MTTREVTEAALRLQLLTRSQIDDELVPIKAALDAKLKELGTVQVEAGDAFTALDAHTPRANLNARSIIDWIGSITAAQTANVAILKKAAASTGVTYTTTTTTTATPTTTAEPTTTTTSGD